MKKLISLLLAITLMMTVVSCSNDNGTDVDEPEVVENSLDSIKERGVLVLGTSADYPPFEFHIMEDGEDKIVGFEIEFGKMLAKDLGVELEIQDMDFSAVLGGVKAGMFDIALAGINPNPERAEEMGLSDVYYQSTIKALVKAEDADLYTDLDQLNDIQVGVQTGTVQEGLLQEHFSGSLTSLGKVTDLVLQLDAGLIDVVIVEEPVAKAYSENNPNLVMAEGLDFSQLDIEDGIVAAVAKENTELLDYINEKIAEYTEEGIFEKLYTEAQGLEDSQN